MEWVDTWPFTALGSARGHTFPVPVPVALTTEGLIEHRWLSHMNLLLRSRLPGIH